MRTAFTSLAIFLLAMVLISCSTGGDLNKPPEIRYGEDICEEYDMIINEARFAAAYYTSEGESRRFDDIGGMCTYHAKHKEDVARFWVHDYETEEWLHAEDAVYVMSSDLYTPMAFGVVAFQDRAQAEALADETSGMVMSFDEVLALYGGEGPAHDHDS